MNKLSNTARILSFVLLFFTGVNAIVAGFLFITDPTGASMGMTTAYLSHSPFSTFLIPGITLFVVNGLLNVMAAISGIKKYKHFPFVLMIQGLLLCGWILIQVVWVKDFNGLHGSMLSIGILLIACGMILKGRWSQA